VSSGKSAEGRSIYWRTVFILAVILIAVAGAGIRVLYVMTLEDMRECLGEVRDKPLRLADQRPEAGRDQLGGPRACRKHEPP